MTNENEKVVVAYKGFGANMQCRGFQYEVGKNYEHAARVEACASGFHACVNPLDVLNYYSPIGSRFGIVELSGSLDRHMEDSKIAADRISIKSEIGLPQITADAVTYVMSLVKAIDKTTATLGDLAHAATSGEGAHAATSGDRANAATSGEWAHAATSGEGAHAATSGEGAHAATSGYRAHAATSGYRANAATSGDLAHAATSGEGAHAATSGYRANAATSGDRANAATSGKHSVAASLGYGSYSKAGEGAAIVCVYRNDSGDLLHIKATKVGETVDGVKIKPNVFYTLNKNGIFTEET